jgi:hypothetical protein
VLLNVVERPLYPDVAYSNIPAAMAEERRDRDVRLARVALVHPDPDHVIQRLNSSRSRARWLPAT